MLPHRVTGLVVLLGLLGLAAATSAGPAGEELSSALAEFEESGAVAPDGSLDGLLVAAAKPAAPPAAGAAPESGGADADELAKKLANPVASLISVPFQLNYDEDYGPRDAGFWTLKVQPVIPIGLNEDWNVISRTILPIVWQESPAEGVKRKSGLGDTVQSFFFSPKEPTSGGWIWGAGPVVLLPTATDAQIGARKWGAGPTALVLRQESGLTYGFLANHIWSFAGDQDRDSVNLTFLQPFVSYAVARGATVALNSESTYDWHNGHWTAPFNLIFNQVLPIGGQPVQFTIGVRYYSKSPDGGPEWGLRFGITLIFPK